MMAVINIVGKDCEYDNWNGGKMLQERGKDDTVERWERERYTTGVGNIRGQRQRLRVQVQDTVYEGRTEIRSGHTE